MKRKTLNFMEIKHETLGREELRNIMAGCGGGPCLIECEPCNNSTCRGYADDCDTGVLEICGPGYSGGSADATCVGPASCYN